MRLRYGFSFINHLVWSIFPSKCPTTRMYKKYYPKVVLSRIGFLAYWWDIYKNWRDIRKYNNIAKLLVLEPPLKSDQVIENTSQCICRKCTNVVDQKDYWSGLGVCRKCLKAERGAMAPVDNSLVDEDGDRYIN